LIINADDFWDVSQHDCCNLSLSDRRRGLFHHTDGSLRVGIAAMRLQAENLQMHFGVHLTVSGDHHHYRWRPLICRGKVPSLVDETGHRDTRRGHLPEQLIATGAW
jgi:hypothetical protein